MRWRTSVVLFALAAVFLVPVSATKTSLRRMQHLIQEASDRRSVVGHRRSITKATMHRLLKISSDKQSHSRMHRGFKESNDAPSHSIIKQRTNGKHPSLEKNNEDEGVMFLKSLGRENGAHTKETASKGAPSIRETKEMKMAKTWFMLEEAPRFMLEDPEERPADPKCWIVEVHFFEADGTEATGKVAAEADVIRTIAAETSGASEQDIEVSDSSIKVWFDTEAACDALYERNSEWCEEMKPRIDNATGTTVLFNERSANKNLNPEIPECSSPPDPLCFRAWFMCFEALGIPFMGKPSCDNLKKQVECVEDEHCCNDPWVKSVVEAHSFKDCGVSECTNTNGAAMRQPLQATTLLFAIFAGGLAVNINGF